ncbi:uncharacterized protein LOC118464663 isoform X1 [Anopheles albimanus]|uniref:uncharacterized protein LOC118464663 isoform X1 n=1 Tax=Anopheles albimanus TaxID=7167 RepID=UPI0016409499|nr:uncharacterized protein LOC118464663 isoform X1 [Anopheles albimanus]
MPYNGRAIVAKGSRANQTRRFKRAKRRNQAKHNGNKLDIDSLPEELLCMVFDRLKLKSVKVAALTCSKWNDIIFSNGYTNRFIFKVKLTIPIPDSIAFHLHSINREQKLLELEELRKTHAEQTLRVIKESQRSYRIVQCETNDTMSRHNPSILAAVHQKFGNSLSTLVLSFDGATMASMFPWIIETIPLMPQLHTLKLSDYDHKTKDQDVIPTLRSPTLKHLEMSSHFKIRLDMPQLQSFEGSLLVLDHPDDSSQPPAVPSLKHLTISFVELDEKFKTVITREPSIIRLLPPIERMVWKIGLSNDELFLAICEACTMLTDLTVTYDLCLSNMSVFSNLEKLTNLRRLSVGSFSSSDESPLHFDFSSLITLEKLAIVNSGVDSLILPKSIKSLELAVDKENERSMIKTLTSCSLQLLELSLCLIYTDNAEDMPTETLEILPRLENLQVLEFYGGYFEKSTFLCLKSPMERLRKLKLEKDYVDTRRFLGLKEKFPNLKQLVMEPGSSRRPQKSTNPDLYASPAEGTKERSRFGYSDSDLESWYDSELDPDSDFEPYLDDSDDEPFFDSEVEEYYRSDLY